MEVRNDKTVVPQLSEKLKMTYARLGLLHNEKSDEQTEQEKMFIKAQVDYLEQSIKSLTDDEIIQLASYSKIPEDPTEPYTSGARYAILLMTANKSSLLYERIANLSLFLFSQVATSPYNQNHAKSRKNVSLLHSTCQLALEHNDFRLLKKYEALPIDVFNELNFYEDGYSNSHKSLFDLTIKLATKKKYTSIWLQSQSDFYEINLKLEKNRCYLYPDPEKTLIHTVIVDAEGKSYNVAYYVTYHGYDKNGPEQVMQGIKTNGLSQFLADDYMSSALKKHELSNQDFRPEILLRILSLAEDKVHQIDVCFKYSSKDKFDMLFYKKIISDFDYAKFFLKFNYSQRGSRIRFGIRTGSIWAECLKFSEKFINLKLDLNRPEEQVAKQSFLDLKAMIDEIKSEEIRNACHITLGQWVTDVSVPNIEDSFFADMQLSCLLAVTSKAPEYAEICQLQANSYYQQSENKERLVNLQMAMRCSLLAAVYADDKNKECNKGFLKEIAATYLLSGPKYQRTVNSETEAVINNQLSWLDNDISELSEDNQQEKIELILAKLNSQKMEIIFKKMNQLQEKVDEQQDNQINESHSMRRHGCFW